MDIRVKEQWSTGVSPASCLEISAASLRGKGDETGGTPALHREGTSFVLRGGGNAMTVDCTPRRTPRPLSFAQRGQALTEVVLCTLLVLVPTFIFGWALYAHGQVRTAALNGARYAAWERTVWRNKPASEIEKLMIERFFARPDAPIRSIYTSETQATNANIPSFYSLPSGDKLIDLERRASQAKAGEGARPTLTISENSQNISTVGKVFNTLSDVMSFAGAGGAQLESSGLSVATVSVKLNAVRNVKVFEDLDLAITQRAAAVGDTWSAGGDAHERNVVKPLVPASALDGMTGLLRALGDFSPFSEFRPGCIRGGVVPGDMLPGGSSQVTGKCS
jgi:hypothetical protein